MLISDAIGVFLRSCKFEKNLSPLTLHAYKGDLAQLQSYSELIGAKRLPELDALSIQNFIAYLKERESCIDSSIRRKLAVVKTFYKFAERKAWVAQDPMAGMRISFRCTRRLPRVLALQQVKQVLEAARRSVDVVRTPAVPSRFRNEALLELLFFSGARISELVNLDIGDVDLESGVAHIKGKGRRERVLDLQCTEVTLSIRRYFEFRKDVRTESRAFFLNSRLRRLSVHSAEAIVRKCAEAADLPVRVTPHMFRHTMATMLLENGADLRSIQEILGHASINTTEIYTHVSVNRKRQVLRDFHPRQEFELGLPS